MRPLRRGVVARELEHDPSPRSRASARPAGRGRTAPGRGRSTRDEAPPGASTARRSGSSRPGGRHSAGCSACCRPGTEPERALDPDIGMSPMDGIRSPPGFARSRSTIAPTPRCPRPRCRGRQRQGHGPCRWRARAPARRRASPARNSTAGRDRALGPRRRCRPSARRRIRDRRTSPRAAFKQDRREVRSYGGGESGGA